jgi:hypothetical protein
MTQLVIELTDNKEIRYDLFDNNSVVIKFIELVNSIKKVENQLKCSFKNENLFIVRWSLE